MLEKKLLTLACVLGILACGACFGPIDRQPPMPPPLRPLGDVQSIRVTVTNASEAHHLDPATLSQAIAKQINGLNRLSGPHAESSDEPGGADAVLAVTIARESAHRPKLPSDAGQWWVTYAVAATLTTNDGRVLWRDDGIVLKNEYYLRPEDDKKTSFNWDAPNVKGDKLYSIAYEFARRMIYLGR
jgi:hypothetical protein